jgi:hypothetical protein
MQETSASSLYGAGTGEYLVQRAHTLRDLRPPLADYLRRAAQARPPRFRGGGVGGADGATVAERVGERERGRGGWGPATCAATARRSGRRAASASAPSASRQARSEPPAYLGWRWCVGARPSCRARGGDPRPICTRGRDARPICTGRGPTTWSRCSSARRPPRSRADGTHAAAHGVGRGWLGVIWGAWPGRGSPAFGGREAYWIVRAGTKNGSDPRIWCQKQNQLPRLVPRIDAGDAKNRWGLPGRAGRP